MRLKLESINYNILLENGNAHEIEDAFNYENFAG